MLLEISKGTVSLGGNVVLDHIDFYIKGTEKAAVVGRNGCGKSTLLRLIAGELETDPDEKNPGSGVRRARRFSVRLVGQQPVADSSETVREYIDRESAGESIGRESAGEYIDRESGRNKSGEAEETSREAPSDDEVDFRRIFTKLGFSPEDLDRKLSDFSGGEQVKIMLAAAFLAGPEVLLLDEPANHLDMESLEWLEDQVKAYKGAVIMVSHDRFFTDRTAEAVWEISGGKVRRYSGNYTDYRREKEADYQRQLKKYEAQLEETARLKGLVRRFKNRPRKASFARSRKRILDRMEKAEKPYEDDAVIHTGDIIPARPGSRNVIRCEKLLVGYAGDGSILKEIDLTVRRGQKIGIFGPNGTGKSAFLKTLAQILPPAGGKLVTGENIDIGYFDQMSAEIGSDKNVFDYFSSEYPSLTGEEVRKILAGYLFRSTDMGKKISSLSGGEKARLVIAGIMEARPNLLILDEPTNNMDIPARETLESVFRTYRGTVIFVSHDRYFLNRVAESLLYFEEGSREVKYYPFDYEHYVRVKEKAKNGVDISGMSLDENRRLLAELKAVPAAERFRLREIPGDEAYEDWRFSLNRPEREAAEKEFMEASETIASVPVTYEEYENRLRDAEKMKERAEKARDRWTASLLEWYDIWLETDR